MPRPRHPRRRRPGPGRAGAAHAGAQQGALRALRRAHRLLETGQYAQAYPILKRLADGAAERGMPVQAATLYTQAARARIEMAAPNSAHAAWDAVALGQQALHLLASSGRSARAQALLAQMLRALERRNYYEQAVELRAEGTALLGARGDQPHTQRAALPTNCPSCNASLRADEVEWIDAQSAECAYCGSVVRTR